MLDFWPCTLSGSFAALVGPTPRPIEDIAPILGGGPRPGRELPPGRCRSMCLGTTPPLSVKEKCSNKQWMFYDLLRANSSSSLCFNSQAPGGFVQKNWYVIFKQILVIDGWGISCKIALGLRPGTPVLEVIFNKYLIFEFSTGNSFLLLGL